MRIRDGKNIPDPQHYCLRHLLSPVSVLDNLSTVHNTCTKFSHRWVIVNYLCEIFDHLHLLYFLCSEFKMYLVSVKDNVKYICYQWKIVEIVSGTGTLYCLFRGKILYLGFFWLSKVTTESLYAKLSKISITSTCCNLPYALLTSASPTSCAALIIVSKLCVAQVGYRPGQPNVGPYYTRPGFPKVCSLCLTSIHQLKGVQVWEFWSRRFLWFLHHKSLPGWAKI